MSKLATRTRKPINSLFSGLCDDPGLADLVDNFKAPASIFVEILVAVGYSLEELERRDYSNHSNGSNKH